MLPNKLGNYNIHAQHGAKQALRLCSGQALQLHTCLCSWHGRQARRQVAVAAEQAPLDVYYLTGLALPNLCCMLRKSTVDIKTGGCRNPEQILDNLPSLLYLEAFMFIRLELPETEMLLKRFFYRGRKVRQHVIGAIGRLARLFHVMHEIFGLAPWALPVGIYKAMAVRP